MYFLTVLEVGSPGSGCQQVGSSQGPAPRLADCRGLRVLAGLFLRASPSWGPPLLRSYKNWTVVSASENISIYLELTSAAPRAPFPNGPLKYYVQKNNRKGGLQKGPDGVRGIFLPCGSVFQHKVL